MNEILASAKTIRQLLGNARFAIDYFQREYRWETKHVTELLTDLTSKFRESYDPAHERHAVANYGHYFLGCIIISNKDAKKFLIDGQQRITTLTLLLIHLYRTLQDEDLKRSVADLIFAIAFGKRAFNLDVEERTPYMEALFRGEPIDDSDLTESNRNILDRYADIEEEFPDELNGDALPYFVDWLIENVNLVEITAFSDEEAYTIFETMNDRGLSLTPTEILKGSLLTRITDTDRRNHASRVWKKRIQALQQLGKEEDADAIKSWLRSQYAETIRERKAGAVPRDFDLIGTVFHRWVRDNDEALGLKDSADFTRFIERDFAFYTRQYEQLRLAAETLQGGLETVYYNAQQNFTLQYPVLLSPLRMEDSPADLLRKLRVTATFIDILITRRIWNNRAVDYSTMQYAMFLVMKDIRRKSASELVEILSKKLETEEETFATNDRFRLNKQNGRQIHRLLARMTDFVETRSGQASRYVEYSTRAGNRGYEVEHIWADKPERHHDEFSHESDFHDYRNRFGGLLLLPKLFNASFGDDPYAKKRPKYLEQPTLLARSLCPENYENNPGFLRFVRESGLPFRHHAEFKKADLDTRHALYRSLAEQIWDPGRLEHEAAA